MWYRGSFERCVLYHLAFYFQEWSDLQPPMSNSRVSVVSQPKLASYYAGKYTEDQAQLTTSDCSAHDSWSALSTLAEIITPKASNRIDFLAECGSGRLDGVRVICRTFASVDTTGRFDEELISCLPASVKFVCHTGMFTDTFTFCKN
jgi:hypothetical protein